MATTVKLAKALKVVGLMNVQFAMKDDVVYVLEVNPRASRTVPFVSKATGLPLAKIAAKVMVGRTLEELGCKDFDFRKVKHISVKEAVFPFAKFPKTRVFLGPEMRSTGEVMESLIVLVHPLPNHKLPQAIRCRSREQYSSV